MNNCKEMSGKALMLCSFAAVALFALSVEAEDIYWIGGTGSQTWNVEENWDLGRKPKWGDTVYITNSVSLSFTGDLEMDAIRVSGGDVKIDTGNSRWYANNVTSSAVEIFVEAGRTLTWGGTYLIQGSSLKEFLKTGAGTFTISVAIGHWSTTTSMFKLIEIREGTLNYMANNDLVTHSGKCLRIGEGGTFKSNRANKSQTISKEMTVDIAEGGTLDLNNSNAWTLRGVTGGGRIINNANGLTVKGEGMAAKSDGLFSGTLSGTVNVVPVNGNAFIVGAADTLANSTLNVTWPTSLKIPLKFAAGIGVFTVNDIPDIDVHADVAGKQIEFVFPGNSWYVDPSRDVSGDGTAADRAFKTFKEAFGFARSGDTVWAAPGVYAAETFTASGFNFRLAIPAGVKVRATGAREETVIDGGKSMRCVCLSTGSHLVGFTVQNGYGTGTGDPNRQGGGIFAEDSVSSAYVVDCDMKNNTTSYRSGDVYAKGVGFYRCRFLGNTLDAPGQGSCAMSTCWSCFVDGYEKNAFYYTGITEVFRNCTFSENNYAAGIRAGDNVIHARNSVFLATDSIGTSGGSKNISYFSCLFGADESKKNNNTVCDDYCRFSVEKTDNFDASYKPLVDGLATDAGKNADDNLPAVLKKFYGHTDLAGVPRRLNGTIDIGACEYDWRPAFCEILTKNKGMTIDDITGGVKMNGTGLTLAGGDRLVVSLGRNRKQMSTYTFSAGIEGAGCLRIYEGGTRLIHEITAASLSDEFTVKSANRISLTFVFRGDGMAAVSNFVAHPVGLKVSLQ